MEENRNVLSKTLFILISIGIVCIGFLMFITAKESIEIKNLEKQWNAETKVHIDKLNDSTYHINLGDGSSCFTIKKITDSLSFDCVNICTLLIKNDSIEITAKQENWSRVYKFAYNGFYNGPIPFKSKIGVNMN